VLPTTSWLSHVPARQENEGGRASEQDDDVVVDLTDARWQCRAAPVVGETGHASGSFSEVVGALKPAHEDGRRVRRLGTDGATGTEARRGRGSLPEEGSGGVTDKIKGRGILL
jgi:hypothetical protein